MILLYHKFQIIQGYLKKEHFFYISVNRKELKHGKSFRYYCRIYPFHNGHLYHLEKAKQETGSTYTVAIMSGNFTQRR